MIPRAKDTGIDTRPGLDSGKNAKSAFGTIEVGDPDTAGEITMRPTQTITPP